MASSFPTNVDSFTTKQDNVDNVLAAHVNDLQAAVVAAQTKLGINSSADTNSVDYKLAHIVEDNITDGHTTTAPSGNAVYDALALKAPLISPSFTTPALGTPASGNLANCTFPTLNQNTTGTAANLSGTPDLPNGTTATTQSANDNSTKLATTAYVDGKVSGDAVGGYIPTDTSRWNNSTEVYTLSTTPVKMKEIKLNQNLSACRIKFTLYNYNSGYTTYGKIYKNGVAIGTLQSTTVSSYTTFSQDFTALVTGDLIQLYLYNNGTGSQKSYTNSLSLCFDYGLKTISGYTVVSPPIVSGWAWTATPTNNL